MNTTIDKPFTDYSFPEYLAKQNYAISFENIREQAMTLRKSDKFIFSGNGWVINPYHGFAVVSMVTNNRNNKRLVQLLNSINTFINDKLNRKPTCYLLPEHSFHQTIANTLSDTRYFENIVDKGLLTPFPDKVEEVFKSIQLEYRTEAMKMRMVGLNIFGSCLALLGVFENEQDYDDILSFRKQFYDNPFLEKNDIKWTRPFIGHITLAYLGREINIEERLLLEATVNEVNIAFDFANTIFHINQTELRSYTDLSCFNTTAIYPVFSFVR